ncbi:IS1595 family transposase [Candidatus Curtissbacteria bacterium]|nr:IS1595 family transposase [Candidatus Curtissbacteria bacterium]
MKGYSCPRCQNRHLYSVRRGKKRCKNCLYEWKPKLGGLGLTRRNWYKVLLWFLLGHSIKTICRQTGISHYSVEKAVMVTRKVMARDVPRVFSGTVEVDETYLGGQKKNKRKNQLRKEAESKRGFGTTKQPVFGILTRHGKVFAKLVDDTEAIDLLPIITRRVKVGSRICSDTWRAYTGLAAKGYVHRTVKHGEREYVRGKNHINGLEGFWGYLKRKLAAKGGVRRKYLPLFLGEYVWRYNYRNMDTEKQVKRILKKITDSSG